MAIARPSASRTAGEHAIAPALARSRDRLAFTRVSFDTDIYRFQAGGPVQLVAGSSSSSVDVDPRLSPDGRRLAFASARAPGNGMDIWVAEADGSNPQQLTHGPGVNQGSPSWSPDGRRIAFDAQGDDPKDSHTHLWMIDADGGAPRRLTPEAGDQVVPTWSHDGRWIYYSWWQADTRDIWRRLADGGAPERLTHGAAGVFACESADRKSLLFQPKDADSPLMTMRAGGRSSAATDRVREEQRVWRRLSGRVLRALRSDPRPAAVCSRSEDRSKRAARQIGRTRGAPPGAQCLARRQHNRVPEAGALTRRPDADRELPVRVPKPQAPDTSWTNVASDCELVARLPSES